MSYIFKNLLFKGLICCTKLVFFFLENAQNKNSAGHKQHYFYYIYISPSIVQFFYYIAYIAYINVI